MKATTAPQTATPEQAEDQVITTYEVELFTATVTYPLHDPEDPTRPVDVDVLHTRIRTRATQANIAWCFAVARLAAEGVF